MTKFKVGDKVRVIGKEGGSVNSVGDIGVIKEFDENDVRVYVEGRLNYANWHGLDEIEHADTSSKQTKSQRIAALEAEAQRQDERILDLERKVAELTAKPAQTPNEHNVCSANEQRKAIIAEAKAFVSHWEPICATKVTFEINTEKRTVVALRHRRDNGRVFDRGIAKAHPDDVFNADIGKAIALGRALGLDVSRFEKAVQPTEYVRGQVVTFPKDDSLYRKRNYRIDTVKDRDSDLTMLFQPYAKAFGGNMTRGIGYEDADENSLPVIDDTEAQY